MRIAIPKFMTSVTKAPRPDKWALGLIAIWLVTALFTVTIPTGKFNTQRQAYYKSVGYYVEYEQQQRAYEEAQNQDDQYTSYNLNCAWYQWSCRKQQYYYMQNNNGDGNQIVMPNWYRFIGGTTEEDRRWKEENGLDTADEANGAIKFVYTWTIVLFVALVLYGVYVLWTAQPLSGLMVALAIFAQMALLLVLMLGQGVIASDNRDVEESIYGWYGQLPILMVYTYFGWILWAVGMIVILMIRAIWLWKFGKEKVVDDDEAEEVTKTEYSSPAVYTNMA